MGGFTEDMRSRLPPELNLPEEIAALFDWIETRGLLHASQRFEGDSFGTLQPLGHALRRHHGAVPRGDAGAGRQAWLVRRRARRIDPAAAGPLRTDRIGRLARRLLAG